MGSRIYPTTGLVLAAVSVVLLSKPSNHRRSLESSSFGRRHQSFRKPILQANGTMLVSRLVDVHPCDYFVPKTFLNGVPVLERFDDTETKIKRIHFHFDDCHEHQLGNRLGEHYLRYLLANALQLPYQMSCGDSSEDNNPFQVLNVQHPDRKQESVLKHLQVSLETPDSVPTDPFTGRAWNVEDVCHACRGAGWHCPEGLHLMSKTMRTDMHKLAYHTQAGNEVGASDDAVIHLRLGDVFRGVVDEKIGLLPNKAYSDILQRVQQDTNQTIDSIGILTQAFERQHVRSFDKKPRLLERSKMVALDLKRHLESTFPWAVISIHNGPSETPLHAMARIVKARKVAICGASTFCTLPTLATQGQGFLFQGEKHSPWAHLVVRENPNKLHSFKVPRLSNNYTVVLEDEEILRWIRNQPTGGKMSITEPPLLR